jgi:hypothetical protein
MRTGGQEDWGDEDSRTGRWGDEDSRTGRWGDEDRRTGRQKIKRLET